MGILSIAVKSFYSPVICFRRLSENQIRHECLYVLVSLFMEQAVKLSEAHLLSLHG